MNQSQFNPELIGVAVIYSEDKIKEYGYDVSLPEAVLVFQSKRTKWYLKDEEFEILFEMYIEKTLSIEEGKRIYPELFL